MKKIFIIVILTFLASCASKKEGPVIYFSNISSAPITDIKCVWNDNEALTLPYLYPGDSRGQSFYISDNSEFFGPVSISWRNKQGRKISREFDFKKNNLPSIEISRSYDYVQFYIEQDWMEIVSSDAPDLSYKLVRMDKILRDQNRLHGGGRMNRTSLIKVEHIPHK